MTFRTPPEDSTGVPHILEHSVLCGSRKFPVKEPFVDLLKGSLQTFLNAFTYPDRTCYPVASQNLKVSRGNGERGDWAERRGALRISGVMCFCCCVTKRRGQMGIVKGSIIVFRDCHRAYGMYWRRGLQQRILVECRVCAYPIVRNIVVLCWTGVGFNHGGAGYSYVCGSFAGFRCAHFFPWKNRSWITPRDVPFVGVSFLYSATLYEKRLFNN